MVTVVTEGEAPGVPDYDSVHGGDWAAGCEECGHLLHVQNVHLPSSLMVVFDDNY